ncbi:MAG: DUF3800 domain-containing protein [Sneathiella sp.]
MFFHIDEAGNTGNNLFDENQPVLSYGVLSSKTNVDFFGKKLHAQILNEIGEEAIHANELGVGKLSVIAPLLENLHKKMKFKFDYYFIDKVDYALIHFFEAVFDPGINPTIKWDTYWTPLRYPFIRKLAELFDIELLKLSWSLCIERNTQKRERGITELLNTLLKRLPYSKLDERSKELMQYAFQYGVANPLKLDFGNSHPMMISPNSVGFQFVIASMAKRIRNAGRKDALGIVVDQQSQFNKHQKKTLEHAISLADGLRKQNSEEKRNFIMEPLHRQLDERDVLREGTPKADIKIGDSNDCIGLQIIDVYLWITNRIIEHKPISEELHRLNSIITKHSDIDGISMSSMLARWETFEKQLPSFSELDDKMIHLNEQIRDEHRAKIQAMKNKGQM